MRTEDVAAAIREVADAVIVPRWRALGEGEVIEKTPGDIVTVADREAEVALTGILLDSYPQALIIGEEATFADPRALTGLPGAAHAFVVDPVDGTKNFAAGSSDFGVMVAETRHGVTTRAWIWQPIHERLYAAERGAGVRLNGEALGPIPDADVAAFAAPRSLRHTVVPGVTVVPTRRSCAIDYPLLLEGTLQALGYRSLNPWDHLPGVLMVDELGGRCAALNGEPFAAGVTSPMLVCARDAALWQRLVTEVVTPEWRADHLR